MMLKLKDMSWDFENNLLYKNGILSLFMYHGQSGILEDFSVFCIN